ncbi:hypothetical protein MMC18_002850 [Xylographa bjoerkii]|nr:hypothetical protein [Xylographa bjoerkii]
MDPLSIIASTIAIIQAGGAVYEALHKLSSLKNAPKIIIQLNNEVAELQLLINAIAALPETIIRKEVVCAAIRKARGAVLALEKLIVYELTKASNRSGAVKIDRLKWLGAENKIRISMSNIHKARLDLFTAVTVVNVESMSAIEIHFEGISSRTQNIELQLQQVSVTKDDARVQARRNQKIQESLSEHVQLTRVCPSQTGRLSQNEVLQILPAEPSNALVNSEVSLNSTESETSDLPVVPATSQSIQQSFISDLVRAFYPNLPNFVNPGDEIRVHFSPFLKCQNVPCTCNCHKQSRRRTPKLLNSVFGSMSIGYSFLPLVAGACNVIGCQSRSPASTISYTFPRWFMNYSLLFKTAGRPYGGPEFLLRVLRPQPSNSRIFLAAHIGNLGLLRRVIEEGEGSLLDVDELGNSILRVASDSFRIDIVRFLLEAGSDCFQENNLGISTYMYHWYRYLIAGGLELNEFGLYGSFNPMVFDFNELHFAVLGLGTVSAETAIQMVARSTIDKKDRMGITALAYAARRGDAQSVEALLLKGADPNVEDKEGSTPLRDAISSNKVRCVQLLLTAGADAHHLDSLGKGLISHAIFMAVDTSVLEVLLSHNISINVADHNGVTPIMDMANISMEYTEEGSIIEILLWLVDHGAELDHQNSNGDTSLMLAMKLRSHLMLIILLQLGADYSIENHSHETLLHYAALFGDMRCLEILQAANLRVLDLCVRNSWGMTFSEVAEWRKCAQEEWSFETLQDLDPDPQQWYNTIKAWGHQIIHLQIQKTLEDADARNHPAEGQDKLLGSTPDESNETNDEVDITDRIPGAYPSA